MKAFTLIAFLAVPPLASANYHQDDRSSVDWKTEQRRQLEAEIRNLKTARGCVDNATTKSALHACGKRLHRDNQEAGIDDTRIQAEEIY